MSHALIAVESVSCRYDAIAALDNVSLEVSPGECVGVVGPNGSGKTTLLRALDSLLRPERGAVFLDGRDLTTLTQRQVATVVGVVPQHSSSSFGFTVFDIVRMARSPHLPALGRESAQDLSIVRRAMMRTHTWHLRDRIADSLSGGERQRVLLARALAQDPKVLLLDEPTAHLDIRYQLEMMDLVRGLKEEGLTVVAALHDLNLASAYCDRLVLLDRGRIAAMGDPAGVLTPSRLEVLYGAQVMVQPHPMTGRPHIIVLGRAAGGQEAEQPAEL